MTLKFWLLYVEWGLQLDLGGFQIEYEAEE